MPSGLCSATKTDRVVEGCIPKKSTRQIFLAALQSLLPFCLKGLMPTHHEHAGHESPTANNENGAASGYEQEYPRNFYSLSGDTLIPMRTPSPNAPLDRSIHSLRTLENRIQTEPVLPLGALIFHCSRCGSTLLARLFELDRANRVFAEPDPLLKFIAKNAEALSREDSQSNLRTFVQAYGLTPRSDEKRLIIKLNSQALLHVEAFRACFPHVPFFYLLRDPVEVVASICADPYFLLRAENRRVVAEAFGQIGVDVDVYTPTEWFAWYIDQNLRLALRHIHQFSAIIDYADFKSQYLDLVNQISGTQLSANTPEVIRACSRHSKHPRLAFSEVEAAHARSKISGMISPITNEAYALWQAQLKPGKPS